MCLFIRLEKAKIRQKPLLLLSEFPAVFISYLLFLSNIVSSNIDIRYYFKEKYQSSFIVQHSTIRKCDYLRKKRIRKP